MLRVTDLVLPLDHPEHALRDAVLQRLGATEDDLLGLQVHRRGVDARKKSAIQWVYTVDVTLRDEPAALARRVPKVMTTPDMDYRFVARANR
jgi:uncharacterized FAD-dependent dehydrogenase